MAESNERNRNLTSIPRIEAYWSRSLAFILALLAVFGIASFANSDETPSVHDLAKYLAEKYQLTTDEIATAVTFWGSNADPSRKSESRLVRWTRDPLRIGILEVGEAHEQAAKFMGAMRETAAIARIKTDFCSQRVSATSGSSYSPSIEDLTCLSKPRDMLVVIDSTPRPPKDLFRDLERISQIPAEQEFWDKRYNADDVPFEHTSCEASLTVDQDTPSLGSGTAYFRVVVEGSENLAYVTGCLQVLPFLMLGQQPIRTSDNSIDYSTQMLQLFYSPELRVGMTLDEIKAILEK